MPPLDPEELKLIEGIAQRLGGDAGEKLRADVANAVADRAAGPAVVRFTILGYDRPAYEGQHSCPVEAIVSDHQGEDIWITLFMDGNDRMLELFFDSVSKWRTYDDIDWQTLRFV